MSRHLSWLLAQLSFLARVTGLARLAGRVRDGVRCRIRALLRFSPTAFVKELPSLFGRHSLHLIAIAGLIYSMGGTWMLASDASASPGASAAAAAAPGSSGRSASGANSDSGSGSNSSSNSNSTSSASSGYRAGAAGTAGATNASAALAETVDEYGRTRTLKKEPMGKLNLNTATEEQLMLLPTVGPSKAERIVTWRKKNGSFRRTADLRRVKGFGYKTFKRLEPYLDIKGDTTLVAKQR